MTSTGSCEICGKQTGAYLHQYDPNPPKKPGWYCENHLLEKAITSATLQAETPATHRGPRCTKVHPKMKLRCALVVGHPGDHVVAQLITDREKEFLSAKGPAFRELWMGKIQRGLKLEERKTFAGLVNAFHATEEPA